MTNGMTSITWATGMQSFMIMLTSYTMQVQSIWYDITPFASSDNHSEIDCTLHSHYSLWRLVYVTCPKSTAFWNYAVQFQSLMVDQLQQYLLPNLSWTNALAAPLHTVQVRCTYVPGCTCPVCCVCCYRASETFFCAYSASFPVEIKISIQVHSHAEITCKQSHVLAPEPVSSSFPGSLW